MKKVLLLITALLTAPGLVSADFWHELSHDANSVSHTVTHVVAPISKQITHVVNHQANSVSHTVTHVVDPISKQITHVVNHQTTVYKKKDLPTINKIIKINHQMNEGALHTVTGACSSVLDEIISKAVGKSCTAFNAEFTASCNAALDGETVGAGMVICGTASVTIATQCKGVVKEELGPAVTNAAC